MKRYLITKHYPGFCDTSNYPDEIEKGYFSTKEELEHIPWVDVNELGKDWHIEIETDGTIDGKPYVYVMHVSNDKKHWFVNGVVKDVSKNDLEEIRTWFHEWKYEEMEDED